MKVTYRGTIPRIRGGFSFAVSGCVHGCVLTWVVLGGAGTAQPRAQSIYDQEIRGHEKRIVWYSLREKLPEIAPADTKPDARPARARVKAPQTMVAGARDDAKAATLIWAPEPEVAAPKAMPLPNVVAAAPPKVVRPFVTPEEKHRVATVAALADAPEVKQRSLTVAALMGSPVVTRGPVRGFVAPEEKRAAASVAMLAEAPEVKEKHSLTVADLGAPVVPRGPVRGFVAPGEKRQAASVAALADAPEMKEHRSGPQVGTPVAAPMGVLEMARATAEASMAIVGLNPAKTIDVPPPPGSRTGGFSTGEQPRADGGTGVTSIALLNVPGLVVRGGAKDTQPTLATNFSPTSKANLLAARVVMGGAPMAAAGARISGVVAPDPRFAGRVVYSIAIQMPNVTSFSGSWLVWFAEREPVPGAPPPQIRAPVVVRKVDPKYIAAAAAERVEGTVRLFGVIGKDGHVGGIALLRQLDERLDRSAQEALAKWEFGPALRDGVPVDVDAIFEIPFHLAPRLNQ